MSRFRAHRSCFWLHLMLQTMLQFFFWFYFDLDHDSVKLDLTILLSMSFEIFLKSTVVVKLLNVLWSVDLSSLQILREFDVLRNRMFRIVRILHCNVNLASQPLFQEFRASSSRSTTLLGRASLSEPHHEHLAQFHPGDLREVSR